MGKIKVIQYATGSTGKQAIVALADHPQMELVGCFVHDPNKVGKDAGEIAGIGPIGVICTGRFEDIVAMEADAVAYMGLWPDLDIICPLLESGKHVLLTGGLIFPRYLGEAVVERLEAACRKGNSCVYGGGLSPGYVETIAPISLTNLARRAELIVIEEFADFHDIPESAALLQDMLGLGRTLDDVRENKHPYFDDMMPSFFNQSIALLADAVELEVERYETDIEHIPSPGGIKLEAFDIPPGTVGGIIATFSAIAGGRPRIQIKLNWIAAPDLQHRVFQKDDLSNSTQWRVTLEGDPSLRLTFEQADSFYNAAAADARKSTDHSFIITAMNIINAIPYICEQTTPGIKHHGNLPLMAGRQVMR